MGIFYTNQNEKSYQRH